MAFPKVNRNITGQRYDVNNIAVDKLYSLYKGKNLLATGTINIRAGTTTAKPIIGKAVKGQFVGVFRNEDFVIRGADGYWWLRIKPNIAITREATGYVRIDVVEIQIPNNNNADVASQKTAEEKLNAFLKGEYVLFHRVLGNDELLRKAAQKGISGGVIAELSEKNKYVAKRYLARRQQLNKYSWLGIKKTGMEPSFDKLIKKPNSITASISAIEGLGNPAAAAILPVIYAAIKWAVIVGGVIWLIKTIITPQIEGQADDVKVAEEIENIIKTHPNGGSEVYEEFEKDMQGQLDESYKKGFEEGASKSTGGWIKNLAIGAGVFFLATKFMDSKKQ